MLKVHEYLRGEFLNVIQSLNYGVDGPCLFFETSKDIKYGDIFTNIACQIASRYGGESRDIGEKIIGKLSGIKYVNKLEVAPNGFINIFLSNEAFSLLYSRILAERENIFRRGGRNIWYFLEIISANPTGLLHIGHARNGIFSDTLGNLLEYDGYFVHREYLINNLGNQIRELIGSVWHKYRSRILNLKFSGDEVCSYNGPEIDELVSRLVRDYKGIWPITRGLENEKFYGEIRDVVIKYFLGEISRDLETHGIIVNYWRGEDSFVGDGSINDLLRGLRDYLTVKDGAVWLKCGEVLGDQKDEVLIKADGKHTYFCQDLIYHTYKLNLLGDEGRIVNVLGSDHHGHIGKMRSFLKIMGVKEDRINFICIQLVKLFKKGQLLKISKRESNVITLRELDNHMTYEEIRWFFVSQPASNPLEIDLEKLKLRDYNNPAFYVMYAYSRICQVLRKHGDPSLYEVGMEFKNLGEEKERELVNILLAYEGILSSAIGTLSPSRITQYLFRLAKVFHSYYGLVNILSSRGELLRERLALINAVKYTIHSGLSILRIRPKQEI